MQITEIDPNKKYVIVMPKASKEFALQMHGRLKELKEGNDTILIIFGAEIAILPVGQVVGYTTFEAEQCES